MKTYNINHTNGNPTTWEDSEDECRDQLQVRYGDDIVFGDDWEAHNPGCERLLVWLDEASAENDAGQNAVAEIVRTAE